ncbi:MAG TPA: FAD-dependent oxidoreductase [Vicinamibacterales bacterium]|nr:FAD-dependent oxidoreductase [Vicinamibacterales bacterium]
MGKPVILAVDDDPEVLGAVERDLKQRYRADYRVLPARSARQAIETAEELKRRGTPVALLLVDQRMPDMTGTQFLRQMRSLLPQAKRVLLTAYADSEAAIAAINEVGLDHYLMKPWDPPEQHLFPVLDDLLADWSSRARTPFDGIRVVGSRWSPRSYETRDFLSRNQIPYQWIDVESDEPMRQLAIATIGGDLARLPLVLLADGTALAMPSHPELAEKVGLQTVPTRPYYDLVVIGGGPAGLACAVYGASEGLKVLLIEQNAPGGQAGTSSMIENYLGFPNGVTGADLARRAAMQAKRFGAEVLVGHSAVGIRRHDPYKVVQLSNGQEVVCHALLLSTGMAVRELDAPGLAPLLGAGVYYGAALSEAAIYRGQHVFVLGGANSAGQGALFFARYAAQVTVIVRKPTLHPAMSHYLVDRINQTENITVLGDTEIEAVHGSGRLERLDVRNAETGQTTSMAGNALFIFIGVAPRTEAFAPLVATDDKGFILTGADVRASGQRWELDRDPLMFETNVPGIFAAGDVRANANRRIAAAVGEGSAAIFSVHQYLRSV